MKPAPFEGLPSPALPKFFAPEPLFVSKAPAPSEMSAPAQKWSPTPSQATWATMGTTEPRATSRPASVRSDRLVSRSSVKLLPLTSPNMLICPTSFAL